ncbi:MAG: hypothetical protein LUD03_03110 [Firmicutes bacterium]|nr:hypothetical protein [Bacillota bacterium]
MLWNLYSAAENSSASISTFKGLDRKYKGSNGEWRDMWNMSSSGYPCLVPRKPRTELYSGEYENVRLVIPPINKRLDDDVPGFTGIADNADGESVLYYDGARVSIDYDVSEDDRGTVPAGYEDSTSVNSEYQEPPRYTDKSVIFPKGEGTEITYAWANNRLFIFVSNTKDFGDVKSLTTSKISGNVITVAEAVDEDTAAAILNRNIILYTYDYNGTMYNLKYYVTAVTAGDAGKATLTLNEDVCRNPYNVSNGYPGEFVIYPMYDSGKYYYDAGKTSSKLYNAEKGIYDEPFIISHDSYTDETLGLIYENVCCLKTGTAYTGTLITFSDHFEVGDRVKLSGFRKEENNTVTVYSDFTEVEDGRCTQATVVGFYENDDDNVTCMYIQMLDADGKIVTAQSENSYNNGENLAVYNPFMSVSKIIPDMNSVVWHNQRLWGTNANGEYFYASAVSDPFTWFGGSYGTASAPVSYASGTQDEYVGLVDYGQYVILLKPTTIQQVYALASSSTVSIAKAQYNVGCIDIHSALVIGSTLYYLGYQGFYAYGGGEPELISSKLNTKYVSAWAVTDGIKYYASAVTETGETEFLVYDTQYSLWHKEDDLSVAGGFIWYDKPVVAVLKENGITAYQLNTDGDEEISWWAESILMFEGTLDNKAVNELWIRAYIPVGESITVYTTTNHMSRDKDIWREHMTLKGQGDIKVYRVPIRAANSEYYRFKLAGTGQCVVYDLERKLQIDGRPYTR